jgi:hypothetical protein
MSLDSVRAFLAFRAADLTVAELTQSSANSSDQLLDLPSRTSIRLGTHQRDCAPLVGRHFCFALVDKLADHDPDAVA